jgi:hypothetical protein
MPHRLNYVDGYVFAGAGGRPGVARTLVPQSP